ncbi:polysaccharide deacetylase family protein [Reyranella sp.]|uniref:polysaccharide deacetylase family protein n=1 Tax=Reyranella sp. TaxID=1929291 RepID=UPI003F713641
MSAPVSKNPPPLPAGMDNPWYDFSPYPKRPKLNWPRNARVAFYVVLHLEYYELLPPDGIVKDSRFTGEFGTYHPDYRTWTQREYGNRTGIFRVLDVLDRYQIRAGVAVNAMAAERYPFLMEQFRKRNYEIIGHGVSANRMISSKMSEAEEKQEIATSLAALEKASGTAPRGWLGQEFGESQRTPKLLADAGLDYVLDWPNDDQPYPMHVGEGRKFVSLPNQPEWDDVQQLWLRRINTTRYPDIVGDAFELLHHEGGQVFNLSIHPWLMGMAHRIKYLDEALRRVERFGNVWHATPVEVAKHYRETMMG